MPVAPLWIVSGEFIFFSRSTTFHSFIVGQQAKFVRAYSSECCGQGGCYFGWDKPWPCRYTSKLRFLITSICAYIDSLGNLAFGPKLGFKNKFRARTGFGLQIEARLQLWIALTLPKISAGCGLGLISSTAL